MQTTITYVGVSMVSLETASKEFNLPIGDWHQAKQAPKVGQVVTLVYSIRRQRYVPDWMGE